MKQLLLSMFIWLVTSSFSGVPDGHLYKVTTEDLWRQSQGKSHVVLADADSESIQLADENDLPSLITSLFPNEDRVIVLKLDPAMLVGKIVRKEESYHLFNGSIPQIAIVRVESRRGS